jgi:hypothetical protein
MLDYQGLQAVVPVVTFLAVRVLLRKVSRVVLEVELRLEHQALVVVVLVVLAHLV